MVLPAVWTCGVPRVVWSGASCGQKSGTANSWPRSRTRPRSHGANDVEPSPPEVAGLGRGSGQLPGGFAHVHMAFSPAPPKKPSSPPAAAALATPPLGPTRTPTKRGATPGSVPSPVVLRSEHVVAVGGIIPRDRCERTPTLSGIRSRRSGEATWSTTWVVIHDPVFLRPTQCAVARPSAPSPD